MKKLIVIKENTSGRNTEFLDTKTKETLTRAKVVSEIRKDKYPGYHIRNINGIATPVSNPNKKSNDNLG